jgi:hypothetical protein
MIRPNRAGLSQREGGAAAAVIVGENVYAISADSERAGAQIVNILRAINPEV